MTAPLMPKATALWLIENTTLTFHQVAEFCGLHALEVQAIADGETGFVLAPCDPLISNQLTRQEIARCEKDSAASLQLSARESFPEKKTRKKHYTPMALRKDRPDGIAWVLKNHPEINDTALCRLLGTTRPTIESIRNRTHKSSATIKPHHPVTLGLCTQKELDAAIAEAAPHAPATQDEEQVS